MPGDEHDLGVAAERRADRREDRRATRERLARRAVAQLEHVAEQDEAVDALRAARAARRARLGPAQDVDAGARAEVQVGDDEGPHGAGRLPVRPPMRRRPLDGLLVADFSRVLAGPLCTMTLGDLGADVVKVERPDGGDDTRDVGPAVARRGRDATTSGSTATSAR